VPVTYPDRTEGCPRAAGPFVDPAALEDAYFVAGTAADVLRHHGFLAAWSDCTTVPGRPSRASFSAVVELAEPSAAGQAAVELAAQGTVNGFARTSVPGFGSPALQKSDQDGQAVLAFTAVGRMLVISFHGADPGRGLAEIGRLMTDQISLLRPFRPTAPAELGRLPADPQGLAGLVREPPGGPTALTGPYDLEGYLRVSSDPLAERPLLVAHGMSGFYLRQSRQGDTYSSVRLWAFPDPAAADAVHQAQVQLDLAGGERFTSTAAPEAACATTRTTGLILQRCRLHARGYVAAVTVGKPSGPFDPAMLDGLLRDEQRLIAG
jgi:hypothetical protein